MEMGVSKTKTFRDNKGVCWRQKKIMWEEQLVDPPIDCKCTKIFSINETPPNTRDYTVPDYPL